MKTPPSILYISREQRDRWAIVGTLAVAFTLALFLWEPLAHMLHAPTSASASNQTLPIHMASKQ